MGKIVINGETWHGVNTFIYKYGRITLGFYNGSKTELDFKKYYYKVMQFKTDKEDKVKVQALEVFKDAVLDGKVGELSVYSDCCVTGEIGRIFRGTVQVLNEAMVKELYNAKVEKLKSAITGKKRKIIKLEGPFELISIQNYINPCEVWFTGDFNRVSVEGDCYLKGNVNTVRVANTLYIK